MAAVSCIVGVAESIVERGVGMVVDGGAVIALVQANALRIPLADQSVQCVVTSPPYWGLRDFGLPGATPLGLEPTPDLYVEHMVEVFREVRRVLRDDGTLWLNMGDCYAHGTPGGGSVFDNGRNDGRKSYDGDKARGREKLRTLAGLKPKDLVGMPWRLAFALQADGWYLRADIIWAKPNPMPESVRDRPTKAHEYVFLLSKRPRYFYDDVAVREPHAEPERSMSKEMASRGHEDGLTTGRPTFGTNGRRAYNPAGRNIRSVWEIATQSYAEAHFATFPEALVVPCIKAGTSEAGQCAECGKAWVRVVEKKIEATRGRVGHHNGTGPRPDLSRMDAGTAWNHSGGVYGRYAVTTLGFRPSCSCTTDRAPVPQLVLDPFGGSGTVALVAAKMGRHAVSIDLKREYLELARERARGVQAQMPLALDVRGNGRAAEQFPLLAEAQAGPEEG